MDLSAALTAMEVAGVLPRPLLLARRKDSRAARAGEMDDQSGIAAHSQMMDLDSAFFQRGDFTTEAVLARERRLPWAAAHLD